MSRTGRPGWRWPGSRWVWSARLVAGQLGCAGLVVIVSAVCLAEGRGHTASMWQRCCSGDIDVAAMSLAGRVRTRGPEPGRVRTRGREPGAGSMRWTRRLVREMRRLAGGERSRPWQQPAVRYRRLLVGMPANRGHGAREELWISPS